MTRLISRVTRACARIGALMNPTRRGRDAKFVAWSKFSKSTQISGKFRSEGKSGRLPRRSSISRQVSLAESGSASTARPDASDFDVAGFCSELEAIRAAMAPKNATSLHDRELSEVAVSATVPMLSPDLGPAFAFLEDDVAEAVRLLEGTRAVRHGDDPVGQTP